MKYAAALVLGMSWTATASAEEPLLRPSRDVDVAYHTTSPRGGTDLEQRVRWRAASETMRIDPPFPGLHVIIDYLARRMSVVRDATRSVVEMAAPDKLAGMVDGGAAKTFVRRGEATVAGVPCTNWQTLDRDTQPALVCITDDGVLLRAAIADQVQVSAVSVRYAPQDPAIFLIPPDYERHSARATP